ncbi:hypothetical protein PORCRE_1565 [Porphyromonas crevioricanis JCM 15906]|uniref:Uncharacterized protein n=1 Tax=Porphyromonas crevioricanis JCM 15906 TaxID=1305617 RepID=T1CIC2_9PORP|nr:hypothetical protein PORCRE_1565 [Porphyromonas crevioricanis JCM 15906]GAD07996.1 hypothetical protein PORCAN_1626 [Porphyromonas crevioricanis JCM 13913]
MQNKRPYNCLDRGYTQVKYLECTLSLYQNPHKASAIA